MTESVELRTTQLLLRPFKAEDVDDLLAYTNDLEWARYLVNIPPVPYSREDAEALVAMFTDPANGVTLQIFAVVLGGKVIGDIYLNQRERDRQNERAELGYSLSRQHWGKGLMTEAAEAVMGWAFQEYSIARMYATCDLEMCVRAGSWRNWA